MTSERQEPGPARTYGTTTRILDLIAVPRESHWRTSHLSLHHMVTSVFCPTKKRGRRDSIGHGYLRLCSLCHIFERDIELEN